MASAGMIYRNYNSTDTTSQGLTISELPQPPSSWNREGYFFKEWNTSRDGSGTSYQPGDGIPVTGEAYAIWYGDYIEAVKDSSGIEHPIKDTISGYITSASVPSASFTTPKMDGTAAVGTETAFARGDHIHPTDTSRQAKITASGILKGNGSGTVTAAIAGTDYQAPLTFDGTYDASTNKAATVSTVTNAINALDGGTIGTGSTTKTITSLSQSNGNVSATFSDIAFPVTSVNGQTGAVTTAEKFVITATAISGTEYYNLDKTFADINVAIGHNKYVTIEDIDATYPYTTTVSQGVVFGATLIATGEGNQLMAVTDGILVVQPDSGTNAMGIAVHSTNVLPTMSDIPSASNTTPLMDGTADVGIQTYIYARADHVHPTDTSRQATLVSGTNIKTINNESILGSGNISISAGSSDVFIAEYGTTTYADILAAYEAGKAVFCKKVSTISYQNTNVVTVLPLAYIGSSDNASSLSRKAIFKNMSGNYPLYQTNITSYTLSGVTGTWTTENIETYTDDPGILSINKSGNSIYLYSNTVNGIVKDDGTGVLSAAVAGTDYQAPLVSGTNIKTINNESLLGSGNINISSGGSSTLFVTVTYANYAYTADTTYANMMSAISDGKNIVAILVDSSQSKSWYYTMTYAPKNTSENFCFATEDELGYFRHLLVGNSDSWWVENIDISSYAKKASPTFTGTPKAPTAAASTNNTQIATTAFVKTVINRTTAVSAADTNYTTYMARGMALNTSDTNPTVNGAISWTYK